MTKQELADKFGVTPFTIDWYVRTGVIPRAHGRGRSRYYDIVHIKALHAYREVVPRPGDRVTAACFAERRQAGLV